MYTGIIKNGDAQSACLDELRIIDAETYSKAQEIMRQRTQPHSAVPLNCKGRSLLVGNIFCAHCGNRLTLTTSGRKTLLPDGTCKRETRARYQCHYKVRHPGECSGQSGYGVAKLDAMIEAVIRLKFSEITAASESELLTFQHKKELHLAEIKLQKETSGLREKEKELQDYKSEALKVIRGESSLNAELLNTLVAETEESIEKRKTALSKAEKEYRTLCESTGALKKEYERLLTWADLYDDCTFEAKKMIVAQLIKAVRVGKGYNMEIDFNTSLEEFQTYSVQNGAMESMQPLRSHTA